MTRRSLFSLLCFVGLSAAPAAQALDTHVTLVTGFPEAEAGGSPGVLIVPGMVIPLGRPAERAEVARRTAERGESLSTLADQLRQTLRLAHVDIHYQRALDLDAGVDSTLPGPTPNSKIQPWVRLVSSTPTLATYQVVFRQDGKVLADTPVSVARGGRAVVGALDGPEAPYLFLLIEPAPEAPAKTALAPVKPKPLADWGDEVVPPQILERVAPAYTPAAREARVQGTVVMEAEIDVTGRVANLKVLKALHPELDGAALDAVRQWTFVPAKLGGDPVPVYYTLTVMFRLE